MIVKLMYSFFSVLYRLRVVPYFRRRALNAACVKA